MKKRIVFKAKIVLGSSAAVLIVFGGHSVMAQTSATGSATKTHEQALREIIRQEDEKFAPRQLPPPTDVDPKLTEESRRLEQQFCDAILAKDAKILDRLLGPEFTLRVADVPQSSLPRAVWMANTLNRLKPESCEQHHHAARKLADDLAVVSL